MNKTDKIKRIEDKTEYKQALNLAKFNSIESEYNLLDKKDKANQLKTAINTNNLTKLMGYIIGFVALIGLIATTLMSILGGVESYKTLYTKIAFILAMIFIQVIIGLISQVETTIKKDYYKHYPVSKLSQYGLLFISINYNYDFLNNSKHLNVTTLILCIIFDLIIIKCISLSSDFRRLNKHQKNNHESKNIISMLIDNVTYKIKKRITNTYNVNHGVKDIDNQVKDKPVKDNQVKDKPVKDILVKDKLVKDKLVKDKPVKDKLVKDKLVKDKPVKDKLVKDKLVKDNILNFKDTNKFKPSDLNNKVKDITKYILGQYKDNECINVKDILNTFKLSDYELKRIRELLKEDNVIYTENKKTYLKPQIEGVK